MLFIIGLALVSMCVNNLHANMEARYLAALQLVEQQAAEEQRKSHAFIAGIISNNDLLSSKIPPENVALHPTDTSEAG